jgi:diguanylate cyclase (GGDEF)-like protein
MVSSGVIIGVIFPFFTMTILNLQTSQVLTVNFFFMCITAGLLVGVFNFFVFKLVVYNLLDTISVQITFFRNKLTKARHDKDFEFSDKEFLINTHTDDPIVGNISNSFNEFIRTIQKSIRTEMITNRFLEDLKQGQSVKDIADTMLNAFLRYFGGDCGCILGYERSDFSILKTHLTTISTEHIDQKELYRIMNANQCVLYDTLTQNPLQLNIVVGDFVPSSIAFIPLKYQDQDIGIAILLAKNTFSRPFNLLESRNFIKQATPFLHNSCLIRRLETLAAIDELTGTLNRRFGMKQLQEEFCRAQRLTIPFSVCMLDLDNFKSINDTYGHQAGDQVLRNVSLQIQEELRSADFIVRYGGEEFLIVLPGASAANALVIIDRMRCRIETCEFKYGAYHIRYTFSGGICSYPSKGITGLDHLIKLADEALYSAKNTGRNKIVVTDQIEKNTSMTLHGKATKKATNV